MDSKLKQIKLKNKSQIKCYKTNPVIGYLAFGWNFEDVVVCDGKVHVTEIHV